MPLLTKLHPPDWWTYSSTHSGTGETETLFFLFYRNQVPFVVVEYVLPLDKA